MRIKRGVRTGVGAWLRIKQFFDVPRQLVLLFSCLIVLGGATLIWRAAYATPPCPCTIFSTQPSIEPGSYSEPGGIELGIKMRFDHDGYISGIRFYKGPMMGGIHSASLWNSTGTVRMANATFINESASGWQEVQFAPVAVTANATYTASVFMEDGNYVATGNYFTSQINNSPFIIQKHDEAWDGTGNAGQGSFASSSTSVYPRSSYNATNYWIDATYIASTDAAPAAITAQSPAVNATNVAVTDAVTATFDKRLNPATVSSGSVLVVDQDGQSVVGVVDYSTPASTIKFLADELWQPGRTYRVIIKGGEGGVEDFDGHSLAADMSWTFTASTTPLLCPCSLQDKQLPTGSTTYRETYSGGLELGLKIVPTTNGYITALRFYKPLISPDASHTGHVWDGQGNLLATATTVDESEYGWQEATLDMPLSVTKDQLYILSFGLSTGDYQANFGKLATPLVSPGFTAYPSNDQRNSALGSGTANSVYTTIAGNYPSSPSVNNAYYYIDAVFSKQAQDRSPLVIVGSEPTDKSYAVARSTPIRLTFDQALNPATVTTATVELRNSANQPVSRTVSVDPARRAIEVTPTETLRANMSYTVTIQPGIEDKRGVALSDAYSWSFTTGAATNPIDINRGAGGPILILTTPGDAYGNYYAEILRTEGIPYFDVKSIDQLTLELLADYVTVIVAQANLNQPQVDVLRSWTGAGGNLIAMRPDKKLAELAGLTDIGATSLNQYLRVDPATTAGAGIVSQSIQFKGLADQYVSSGATTIAQLYSDATASTPFPAVTTRAVGRGTASVFTYDLARSVIALHQGNQAWSAQDRNGDGVIRTNDLFYGAKLGDIQSDWLDPDKMAIPQADEQQRLLINLMTEVTRDKLPMPRFWYLPNNQKAALVLAGDDHNLADHEGTRQHLNNWLNQSTSGCSVVDWQCLRATHYVFAGSGLTDAQASQLVEYGFEIGDHPSEDGQCSYDDTYSELYGQYSSDLTVWRSKYSSVPYQTSARYHCYSWSNWDMMPRANQALGVRYDLNTVAYPASWVSSRSPMVTGSGMNMRFTDATGALLDVHQGVTNFDNTAANETAIAAMLDNAIGVNGYYGIFGSHYDMGPEDLYHKKLTDMARSRGVPLISAEQALEWLTSREQSAIREMDGSTPGRLVFGIEASEGAHGLQAMLPFRDASGTIARLLCDGVEVNYHLKVVKGVSYAVFDARPGSYEATYSDYGQAVVELEDSPKSTTIVTPFQRQGIEQQPSEEELVTPASMSNAPSGRRSSSSDRATQSEPTVETSAPWYSSPAVVVTGVGVTVATVAGTSWWLGAVRRRNNNGNI